MTSRIPREPHPNPQILTPDLKNNSMVGIDYEPHPQASIEVPWRRRKIVERICALYSGSASEEDMQVSYLSLDVDERRDLKCDA